MQEHLACRRKQQREDQKQKQNAPEAAPIIPVRQIPQVVLEVVRSQATLVGKIPVMVDEIATKGYTIQHFHTVDADTVELLKSLAQSEISEGIDNEGEALKETPKPDHEQCRRALPLTPDIPGLVGLFNVLTAFVAACGPQIFN